MPVVDGRYSVYNEGCGQTDIPETFTLIIGTRFLDPESEIREYYGEVLSTNGIAPLPVLLRLLVVYNLTSIQKEES